MKVELALTNLGDNLIVHSGVNEYCGVLVLEALLVNADLVVAARKDWLDGVEALAVQLDVGGDRDQLAVVLDKADVGLGLSHRVVIDAVPGIDFQANIGVEGGGGRCGGGGGGRGGGGGGCRRRAGARTEGGGGCSAVTECDVLSHSLQVVGRRGGGGGRGEPEAGELSNILKHFISFRCTGRGKKSRSSGRSTVFHSSRHWRY